MKKNFSIGIAMCAIIFSISLVGRVQLQPAATVRPAKPPKPPKMTDTQKTGTSDRDGSPEYSEGSPTTEANSATSTFVPGKNMGQGSTGFSFGGVKTNVKVSPPPKPPKPVAQQKGDAEGFSFNQSQNSGESSLPMSSHNMSQSSTGLPLGNVTTGKPFNKNSKKALDVLLSVEPNKSSPLFELDSSQESFDQKQPKQELFNKLPTAKRLDSKTPLNVQKALFDDSLKEQQPLESQPKQMVRITQKINPSFRTTTKNVVDGVSAIEPIISEKISGPVIDKMKTHLDSNQTMVAAGKRADGKNYMIASKADVKKGYFKNKTTETLEIIEFDEGGSISKTPDGTPIKISLPIGDYSNKLKFTSIKKNKQATRDQAEIIVDDITSELIGKDHPDVIQALKDSNPYKQYKSSLVNKILAPSTLTNTIGAIKETVNFIADIDLGKFVKKLKIKKPLDRIAIGVRNKTEWEASRPSTTAESILPSNKTFYSVEDAVQDINNAFRVARGKNPRFVREAATPEQLQKIMKADKAAAPIELQKVISKNDYRKTENDFGTAKLFQE